MNISPATVKSLRDAGWQVLRVSAILPASTSDEEILDWAWAKGMVLITQDLDFSRYLAISGRSGPSVINLRLLVSDPDSITAALFRYADQLEESLATGCAVTIDDRSLRVRRLPIVVG